MKQVCKTCKYLGFDQENMISKCTKNNFDWAPEQLDPHNTMPEFMTGEYVEIGGKFYATDWANGTEVTGTVAKLIDGKMVYSDANYADIMSEHSIKKASNSILDLRSELENLTNQLLGEEPVDMLVDSPLFERIDQVGEEAISSEMDNAIHGASRTYGVENPIELAKVIFGREIVEIAKAEGKSFGQCSCGLPVFDDLCPWCSHDEAMIEDYMDRSRQLLEETLEQTLIDSKGVRFGVRYRFLGATFQKAFVEPFTWEFSCADGVHKWLNQPFTDYYIKKKRLHKFAPRPELRLAKAMWVEKTLREFHKDDGLDLFPIQPEHCEICGAPVSEANQARICAWCEDEARNKQVIIPDYVKVAKKVMASTKQVEVLQTMVTVSEVAIAYKEQLPRAAEFLQNIDIPDRGIDTMKKFISETKEQIRLLDEARKQIEGMVA